MDLVPAGSFNLASDHTYRGGHSGDSTDTVVMPPYMSMQRDREAASNVYMYEVHVGLPVPPEVYLVPPLPMAVVESHPIIAPMPNSVEAHRALLHLPVLCYRVIWYPKRSESG